MCRKLCVVVLVALFATVSVSAEPMRLGVGVDLSVVDAAWTNSMQCRVDITCTIGAGFGLRIPFSASVERDDMRTWLLDTGLFLDYHPWGSGPFIAVSIAQVGIIVGRSRPKNNIQFLNEVILGWTQPIVGGLYVEPALVVRDPSSCFAYEYETVRDLFPSQGALRFSMVVGWAFSIG